MDKIRNTTIKKGTGVMEALKKMLRSRLRWYGHAMRRNRIELKVEEGPDAWKNQNDDGKTRFLCKCCLGK